MLQGTGTGRAAQLAGRLRTPVEVLGYLFWLAADGVAALSGTPGAVAAPVIGAGVAAVVLARGRLGPHRAVTVAFGLSAAATVVGWTVRVVPALPWPALPSMSFCEQLALAVVTISALQRTTNRESVGVVVASGAVIVSSPLLRPGFDGTATAFVSLSVMGWIGTAAIGLALREAASRRRAQLQDARSAERMELARELHDVVAHHVTGIVVAAQAASVVARTRPDEVDRALASIEHAGADALTAMRRMVGVLRGQTDGARTPGADLAGIAELVRRFDQGVGGDGDRVRLRTDPGIEHAVLPAGVAATGYRVVQEALTNVRRHAPGAATVEVELHVRDEHLQVTVRNDGVGPERPAIPGGAGGFGLAGMGERVAALDGVLHAGPTGPGVWTVAARLPIGVRP
ncbi:histidine kinase [Pseudonocardia sediminis]|uniref:histidine kinase n=1 Tax=Pseudonocardia sediminis TaxID=1397368 RepID=A0A4Q7V2S5_PSEST|nr:histidine kinase [Pseudonocardia sediminis]RZT88676.1 histidine kinase [Pseudonocardia sediminis]